MTTRGHVPFALRRVRAAAYPLAALIVLAPLLLAPAGTSGAMSNGSSNWAGYVITATLPHSIVHVTGYWTQPVVQCSSRLTQAHRIVAWAGIDGYPGAINKTVQQTGTTGLCKPGQPVRYYAWWQTFREGYPSGEHPLGPSYPVLPGDQVTADVLALPWLPGLQDVYRIELDNRTRPWHFGPILVNAPGASGRSAEAVIEGPDSTGAATWAGLPDGIRFAGLLVNDRRLADYQPIPLSGVSVPFNSVYTPGPITGWFSAFSVQPLVYTYSGNLGFPFP